MGGPRRTVLPDTSIGGALAAFSARSSAFAGTSQPTRTVTVPVTTTRPASPGSTSIFPRIVETSRSTGPGPSTARSNGNRCAAAGFTDTNEPKNRTRHTVEQHFMDRVYAVDDSHGRKAG